MDDDDKYDISKNFRVVCVKCGSARTEVSLDCGHYEDTGTYGRVYFICQNCGHEYIQH